MEFYILVFIIVGFVVGLFTSEKISAYFIYIIISAIWFFVWGPFAVAAFLELVIGDYVARKIKFPFQSK